MTYFVRISLQEADNKVILWRNYMKTKCILLSFPLVATLVWAVAVRADWYDNAWDYRTQITIQSNLVTATLANFPVLVVNTNPSAGLWSNARTDGEDILFTASDGTNKLDHEIEEYNPVETGLWAWVKVPVLPDDSDTVIYMYYGNPGATDQQNVSGVWANGYQGVWHFNDSPTNAGEQIKDSTAYSNDGACQGTMTDDDLVAGVIAGCIDFDRGTSDYILVDDAASLDGFSAVTVSFWMNTDADDQNFFALIKGIQTHQDTESWCTMFGIADATWQSQARFEVVTPTPNVRHQDRAFNMYSTNTWEHYAWTWDSATSDFMLYKAGSWQVTFTDKADEDMTSTAWNLGIGAEADGGGLMDGRLDEGRLSSVARSAEWIETSYNSQNDPGSFMSFDAETPRPIPGTIVTVQ